MLYMQSAIIVILLIVIVYMDHSSRKERASLYDRIQAGTIQDYKAYADRPAKAATQSLAGTRTDLDPAGIAIDVPEISLVDAQASYRNIIKGD